MKQVSFGSLTHQLNGFDMSDKVMDATYPYLRWKVFIRGRIVKVIGAQIQIDVLRWS